MNSVRGHDRLCGFCAGFDPGLFLLRKLSYAGSDAVNRQLEAYNTCRSHENGVRVNIKTCSCFFSGLLAVFHSFTACACICYAGINDHRVSRLSAVYHVPVPDDRGSFDYICCKSTGTYTGLLTENERHVGSSFIFNMRGCRCCFKTLRGCDASLDLLHLTPPFHSL